MCFKKRRAGRKMTVRKCCTFFRLLPLFSPPSTGCLVRASMQRNCVLMSWLARIHLMIFCGAAFSLSQTAFLSDAKVMMFRMDKFDRQVCKPVMQRNVSRYMCGGTGTKITKKMPIVTDRVLAADAKPRKTC